MLAKERAESDRSADTILAFNFPKILAKSSFEDRESGATARNKVSPVHKICSFRCTDGHFEGVPPTRAERISLEKRKENRHSAALNGKAVKENENGMSVELRDQAPPPFNTQSADESTHAKTN